MNKNNKSTKCPTCGSTCRIGGDDKEGTHYYVPEEDDLRAKIQDLEKECQKYRKELETFVTCLALASKVADESTANSYREWIRQINGVLTDKSKQEKTKCRDKCLKLANSLSEMEEVLEKLYKNNAL